LNNLHAKFCTSNKQPEQPIDIPSEADESSEPIKKTFDYSKVSKKSESAHEFKAETKQLLQIFSKSL